MYLLIDLGLMVMMYANSRLEFPGDPEPFILLFLLRSFPLSIYIKPASKGCDEISSKILLASFSSSPLSKGSIWRASYWGRIRAGPIRVACQC